MNLNKLQYHYIVEHSNYDATRPYRVVLMRGDNTAKYNPVKGYYINKRDAQKRAKQLSLLLDVFGPSIK